MPDRRGSVEQWSTRLGAIIAVAAAAVGLGNFLRFPGKAAYYSGSFLIPYFCALVLLGIPICWVEWTLGRMGGRRGFNSAPGIFMAVGKHPAFKYAGSLALIVPVTIYMYYVYIESWCLAYAWYYLIGYFERFGGNASAYATFFDQATGVKTNGAVFSADAHSFVWFFIITFFLNLLIVYRGLSKGIETFCLWAMPTLVVAGIIVCARVLTLPEQPTPEPWHLALAKAIPRRALGKSTPSAR